MSNYNPVNSILNKIEGVSVEYSREVLKDLWICLISREVSITGRKEVLGGKAKFGILGDGKELPQVAMARAFEKGDFRSGYYRDQTFMFALDLCTVQEYFAQLYADPFHDPFSGGRQMNAHFATPLIDKNGNWLDHTQRYNVSSDISPTSGQMARALGLALASKHYRNNPKLQKTLNGFSNQGNEVSFVTIGDASTSEGVFWETINAAAVQQIPLAVFVWDDGYGISVPIELQTVKQNISEALKGFIKTDSTNGIFIEKVKAWDYPNLVHTFQQGIKLTRETHTPILFHVEEVTQPQGHSTSGSHERYKSKERLEWEINQDCLQIFIQWILDKKICDFELIEELKTLAKSYVRQEKNEAWNKYLVYSKSLHQELISIIHKISLDKIDSEIIHELLTTKEISVHELLKSARTIKLILKSQINLENISDLDSFIDKIYHHANLHYHTNLIAESERHYSKIESVSPEYNDDQELNGYQIINKYFNEVFEGDERLLAFGEDVGQIGDVNQGFAGLQERFGKLRVFDTGIREWTIIGQAIGLSMRGLRPIAEMQYLDYVVYALSALTDDLSTLRYRSNGIQQAPAIIRTRGHRLEGIWHSGSPIGMLLHSLRGMHICVPRNFTQAVGMYNTLLASSDPGMVIECLNAYRLKEKCPINLKEFKLPLGKIEILKAGKDITLVSYGSCIRIAESAIQTLEILGISVELIDLQSLLPMDDKNEIRNSLEKTNKLVIVDEDVPGGASAFILDKILSRDNNFNLLDCQPRCISAQDHRPPYGSDGDYFSKPNAEDIVEICYEIMKEYNPSQFVD
ncbi:MAG: transketolase [Saprospiraceae bacterium]|nr:transketolase [Saprospiraceae bacterium]